MSPLYSYAAEKYQLVGVTVCEYPACHATVCCAYSLLVLPLLSSLQVVYNIIVC